MTLFASGDSKTRGTLAPIWPKSLRLSGDCVDVLAPHLLMVEEVARRAGEFDLVHFHIAHLHFPVARRLAVPHVTTLHGRLDLPELAPLFREFSELPVVSISRAQRTPLPRANWLATVPHGLPPDEFRFHPHGGPHFAFLGRISPEKRVDRAIAIARACGRPIRIAAKIDPADRAYFEREIRPLLDDPLVEFVGEIGDREKNEFLGGAAALLFPIDWPEPFGLVMIEALASGTPVIAFRGGSVPEVIEDGVTGFVVDDLEAAASAARHVHVIDRRACRSAFERRFTASRMASGYLRVYEQVIANAPSNLVA